MGFKTKPLGSDGVAIIGIDDEVELLDNENKLVIDEEIDGKSVVAIEKTAFANASRNVHTIVIPASVESIDRDAFGNNLVALHSIVVA